jgi:tetratricopeptide (TPR) repeat protein
MAAAKSVRIVLSLALLAAALPFRAATVGAVPTVGFFYVSANSPVASESRLGLPPDVLGEAHEALDQIFHARTDAAVAIARGLQKRLPDHPIGYLLEVEADWWALYCQACSIRYNLIDAWSRQKLKHDDAYFALADQAVRLAEAQIARQESAPMHVFAGMGYGLEARLSGVRGDHRPVARAGVKGREHFLRALAMDPQMGDALTGIGLYNYLADVLSPFAKFLRFFMGIPGGNKKEGIRQLEKAMNTAELTAVEARFYLARNLRNFDEQYARSVELMEPLVKQYPDNPVFQLLLGNLYASLNRKDAAALHFRAAREIHVSDAACAAQVQDLAAAALAALER